MTWNYANEDSLKSAPPNQFQGPQGVQYQVAPNQFQPGQTVIVPNGFDSSARFHNGTASIPPPPPGHVPNAAQVAASQGANVQIGQKKESFLTGGEGGGYTMWWIELERTTIFPKLETIRKTLSCTYWLIVQTLSTSHVVRKIPLFLKAFINDFSFSQIISFNFNTSTISEFFQI